MIILLMIIKNNDKDYVSKSNNEQYRVKVEDYANESRVENYINNYEQGGMQLDPHPHKDNINTPAYQTGNSTF